MAKAKRLEKLKRRQAKLDLNTMVKQLGPCPKVQPGMNTEQQRQVAKDRVTWQRSLRDLLETHRKRSRIHDVEWAQEQHSPTVEIAVDDPESKRKTRRNLTRVRQSEAWRHNRLSGMQRDAEKEMEFAWRQRTAGTQAAVSKYGIQRGGSNRLDLGSSVEGAWLEWASLAHGRRIMVDATIDCFAEPMTLAQVEHRYRMRRGQAFDNYVRALDLWCEVRGWIRGPALGDGPHLEAEGVAR